ncbi:universal stress protein [Pseudosporangium ferrugineum]|uniref:Nucleotide-binding universal stress UspA family protein n=1 Tax=Pseudosporangium ferrugineum TaxID=439699 RepID=A0A2T0S6D0_9ACTN|nr:universal stress protein [Pseudosporangium ferrugineum]PRY28978.1 nucleotide-binding universal stress UspA family protein [Pseudosporangium ferrugineum]
MVWLTEGTWQACADAAREFGGEITLLHVVDVDTEAALSGSAGLLGRVTGADPGELLAAAERRLVDAATERLGREVETLTLRGRPEREVVTACAGADLLILARDGDRSRLGPRSLGHRTRFVVDHAPCRILLVWPDGPPGIASIP